MTPERWQRIKSLFHEAVGRPLAERQAFLDQACQGDTALRAEIVRLLAADEHDGTLFDSSVGEVLEEVFAAPSEAGQRFGAYRVVREIGRGGMAVVFAAVRDDDQYEKQVAVKLIKRGMDTDAIVARFRQERQILARLEHPAIARLIDGGMSEEALPYLVMEYVEGTAIDAYCEERALSTDERLGLFQEVCTAVGYAHRNLVVHRDLKPSNILVTSEGASAPGRIKLLDFGIAKLLDPQSDPVLATRQGLRPMTPEYASPEQVRGQPVTTANDVYALGVLLYQLVTGRRPYRIESRTPQEIERVVCEKEPEPPSAVRPGISRDLDAIVRKAMHKAVERRYGSVDQLNEDLRRYLERLPVLASGDSLAYRAALFVRRHRWGVAAAFVILLLLLSGVITTAWQARAARIARADAEWVSSFMTDLFRIPQVNLAEAEKISLLEILDRGVKQIRRQTELTPDARSTLLDELGFTYLRLGDFEGAEPLLEEALEQRRHRLGHDHPTTAASLRHVGDLRAAQQRWDEAEHLIRRSLSSRLRYLGESHELVAESANSLALVLLGQGRDKEAEAVLRRTLEQWSNRDHPEVAHAHNNLGVILRHRGRLAEAERHYREALERHQRHFGTDHPDMATYLSNFASVLRILGQRDEAIEKFTQALELQVRLTGKEHPRVASIKNNLAGCHMDLGQYDKAAGLFQESLELARATWGQQHTYVAVFLSNMGENLFRQGRIDESAAHLLAALSIYESQPGQELQGKATTLDNLGAIEIKKKNYEAAERYRRRALTRLLDLSGEAPIEVATVRHNLADTLRLLRRLDEAEKLYEEALEVRLRSLGAKHPSVGKTLAGLGRVRMEQEKWAAAAEAFDEALEVWRQWPEREWARLASTSSQLGGCLTRLGQFEQAQTQLLEAYKTFRTRSGVEDSRTLATFHRLLRLAEAWGRPDKAATYRALHEAP